MKKIFDINLVDPLSFIGTNDKNIKLIENNFNTSIVVRGNQIKLDGNKDEIIILSKIFNNMLLTIEKRGLVEESDIQILNLYPDTYLDYTNIFLYNPLDYNLDKNIQIFA